MISSIATLATMECAAEYRLFHAALRRHHPELPLIVATTTDLAQTAPLSPATTYLHMLDKYPKPVCRKTMEATAGRNFRTLHDDFMMEKANVLEEALSRHPNCLLIDCDVVMLAPLPDVPSHPTPPRVGLSPHGIMAQDEALFGKYNGGWVYTDDTALPHRWRHHTRFSRYYDQAALEDVARDYGTKGEVWEVPPQCNFGYWRLLQSDNPIKVLQRFSIQRQESQHMIYLDETPLQSVHTHFCMPQLLGDHGRVFNRLLTTWMQRCGSTYEHILSLI